MISHFYHLLSPKTASDRAHTFFSYAPHNISPPLPANPFRSQPHTLPTQKNSGRLLASWSGNTLWALRASFEIRRLRRLSRGSADPREYSRSWRLVQSCPAHVARPGSQEYAASLLPQQTSLTPGNSQPSYTYS